MQGARQQPDFDESSEAALDRDWTATAIRAIPVALIAIVAVAGMISWQSAPEDEVSSGYVLDAVRSDSALKRAEDAGEADEAVPGGGMVADPGLEYSRERPQLYVQGTANANDRPSSGAVTSSSGASTTEPADGPTTTGSADPSSTAATGRGRSATTGQSTASSEPSSSTTARASSTTARRATTTTTARATTTTARPTTASPTTAAPTTAAPTTAAPTTAGGNCGGGGEFERVFRDDFNGSSVSGSWSQYNSSGNSNYGLRRPSAISVSNGRLVITAKMENGTLVSGGMSHRFDQKYGKWVVKVRTDNDPSQAVSGVVLTWPQSGVHPRDGENNIYETLVKTANRNPFFTFIHKPFGSKSDQEYYKHNADGSQFQVMTMEWTPNRITITREGPGGSSYRDVWTVNETGADLIPDVPHHMAIQLDAWKHSIGGPVRMEVDFVEVYKYCG